MPVNISVIKTSHIPPTLPITLMEGQSSLEVAIITQKSEVLEEEAQNVSASTLMQVHTSTLPTPTPSPIPPISLIVSKSLSDSKKI